MGSFKVPYGVDSSGALISASEAFKNEVYNCPCCKIHLIHRSGDVRAKHFAHPVSSSCNPETILHITAKALIEGVIRSNASSSLTINLRNHCCQCGVEFNTILPHRTFTNAQQEIYVSKYICDVVGYRGDEIALAVEILNTHKVDALKGSNLPIHWVELKAEDVISNPTQWNPTQSKLKFSFCQNCKSHIKHVHAIAEKWGIDKSIYSPVKDPSVSTYIADSETCFKCNEEIPVFWWKGVPFCEEEPPEPKPKTIKCRNSKQYGGKYWANTCANCNIIQGDNYLYVFDSAPFKNMPLSGEAGNQSGGLTRVVSGKSAVSEFMKVVNRNI